MKLKLLTASILALTGCATYETPFHSASIHYNRVVAGANNELILLNILRAKERQPMYFSALTQLNGSLSYGGSTTIGTTLNDSGLSSKSNTENFQNEVLATASVTESVSRGLDVLSPSVSANISSNPSFQYQLLDTQEFYQGITRSVPAETIINYLEQGWSSDLLEALLIERITNKESPSVVTNSPSNSDDGSSGDFADIIECFDFFIEPETSSPSSVIEVDDLSDLDGVSELIGDGATLKTIQTNGVLRTTITVSKKKGKQLIYAAPDPESCQGQARKFAAGTLRFSTDQFELDSEGEVTIRSVQSAMYFLGEYLRDSDPYKIKLNDGNEQCLFGVIKGAGSHAFVTTKLYDDRYHVSREHDDKKDSGACLVDANSDVSNQFTLRTLSLLNQLINLQKSAKDRPQTITVRSLN